MGPAPKGRWAAGEKGVKIKGGKVKGAAEGGGRKEELGKKV